MIIPISYSPLTAQINRDPEQFNKEHTSYNTEAAYSAVNGSMLKVFQAGVKNIRYEGLIIVLLIILEPISWLTKYYLRMSSLHRRQRIRLEGGRVDWVDLASSEFSPVTLVLEYLSWLSAGFGSRLILLFGRKYKSFEEWAANECELLKSFRTGMVVATSWLHDRSFEPLMKFPWKLAKLVDRRQSELSIQTVVDEFDSSREDSLKDEFFTLRLKRMLHARGLRGSALRYGLWRRVLLTWIMIVIGAVAPVEFMHGRNNRRANGAELWAHFIAKFFVEESRRYLIGFLDVVRHKCSEGRRCPRQKKVRRVRQPVVRDLFNREQNEARKGNGLSCRIDTEQYWTENSAACESLTAEQIQPVEAARQEYLSARQVWQYQRLAIIDRDNVEGSSIVSLVNPQPHIRDMSCLFAANDGCATMDGEGNIEVFVDESVQVPLCAHILDNHVRSDNKGSVGNVYSNFANEQTSITKGTKDLGHVLYPRKAGNVVSPSLAETRLLRSATASAIESLISSSNVDSKLWGAQRFLFEFRTSCTDEVLVQYFFIASGAKTTPLIPFRLNCIQCDRHEGVCDEDTEFVLQYSRLENVHTRGRLPFVSAEVSTGMFKHMSFDVLIASLVPEREDVLSVNIALLMYTELGGDRFRVLGVSEPACERSIVLADVLAADDAVPVHPTPASEDDMWDVLPNPLRVFGSTVQQANVDGVHEVDEIAEVVCGADHEGIVAALNGDKDNVDDEAHLLQIFGDFSSDDGSAFDDLDEAGVCVGDVGVAPTVENCIDTLSNVQNTDAVTAVLSEFDMDFMWVVWQRSTNRMLSKSRCIVGRSMRADCRVHSGCKIHMDIADNIHQLNVQIMLWSIAGGHTSVEEHTAQARTITDRWRVRCRGSA